MSYIKHRFPDRFSDDSPLNPSEGAEASAPEVARVKQAAILDSDVTNQADAGASVVEWKGRRAMGNVERVQKEAEIVAGIYSRWADDHELQSLLSVDAIAQIEITNPTVQLRFVAVASAYLRYIETFTEASSQLLHTNTLPRLIDFLMKSFPPTTRAGSAIQGEGRSST